MAEPSQREQLDRVRDRFTRSAEQFSRFALTNRGAEADRLVELACAHFGPVSLALDLACGPGTFAKALAPRVARVFGVDLTPAMLDKARQAVARAGISNVALACADANVVPLRSASCDLAVCGYSFHHFLEPARPIREMARVVRPGGRVAAVDLIIPPGADSHTNNSIERARDASHVQTLTSAELCALFESSGLRVISTDTSERPRDFDDWMITVGSPPGTAIYAETRRLMEAAIQDDRAGFHPRLLPAAGDAPPALAWVQTSFFLVAEKP